MFNISDVYPGYKGQTLAQESAVDAQAQDILAQEGQGAQITASKPKVYNITSAIVTLVLVIILLQMTK